MLTIRTAPNTLAGGRASQPRPAAQTVLIVNGDSNALTLLEPVLDAANYHVVFVEASRHAYSQIRRTQPNLVILCLDLDDVESFQVLSMLKLDEATRDIPVVTCMTRSDDGSDEDQEEDEEEEEQQAPMFAAAPPPLLMN